MKNIGIFGIGAIGSIMIKYLKRQYEDNIYYFNRSKKEVVKIKFNEQIERIPIMLSGEITIKLDWIIVCLKEYHYQEALSSLKKLITTKTKVAIFQNGIDLKTHFINVQNQNNLLETIIDCPCQQMEPNFYLQIRAPKIILPNTTLGVKFKKLIGIHAELKEPNNFKIAQWKKLIESSALGSLQVKYNQPCSLFKNENYRDEYLNLIEEGIQVSNAENVDLDINLKQELLAKLLDYPESKRSSMLTDKILGNQMELNAKIGAIVRLADKNQLSIPNTRNLYKFLLKENT